MIALAKNRPRVGCPTHARTRTRTIAGAAAFACALGAAAGAGAAPPAPPPARLRVSAALVDGVVRELLPVDLVLSSPLPSGADAGMPPAPAPATLIDLRYCGAGDKGAGRLRAVIRLGGAAAAMTPPALAGDGDCKAALPELAKRIAEAAPAQAGAGGTAVVDVDAVWRAWELRLVVVRAATAGVPKPFAALDGHRELLSVSTAGYRIATDAGPITLHLAPTFTADGIEVAALIGDGGAAPPASVPAGRAPAGASDAGADVVAELPFAFANRVLQLLTASHPIAIPVDRDVVDVDGVSVSGSAGSVAVSGLATPRSVRETARVTVQANGADLKIASVRAEAQLENCSGQGMLGSFGCNGRNAARGAGASTLAAAAEQQYRGHLLRELAGSQELRVEVGRRAIEVAGDIVRVSSTASSLVVGARLAPAQTADGAGRARP